MALWRDRRRARAEVKRLALQHLAAIEENLRALEAISATLRGLASACHGDDRPDCPILDGLAGPGQPGAVRAQRSRPGRRGPLENSRRQV